MEQDACVAARDAEGRATMDGRSLSERKVGRGSLSAHTIRPAAIPVEASQAILRSPLRHLDPAGISERVRVESRNRELHLPPIGVYRWWARRTEAVNGALIDAVNLDKPGKLLVSDPFAGGGVIPLAAAIRGHDVYAQDLNPWAANGLRAMFATPSRAELLEAFATLQQQMSAVTGAAYGTLLDDGTAGEISHTFRVASSRCTVCGTPARMFPHALVSLRRRAERGDSGAFLACTSGHLFPGQRDGIQQCPTCEVLTDPAAKYTARRMLTCHTCHHSEKLDVRAAVEPFTWDVVLVERSAGRIRELALPRPAELAQAEDHRWQPTRPLGVIPDGHETSVLLRHGFRAWEDLFPRRQRWFIERLLIEVDGSAFSSDVRDIMTQAIVGATEMAGLLSRWDRFYLKSYESMANHRFNFTTFSAEPNVWGTVASGRGTVRRRVGRLLGSIDWWESKVGTNYSTQFLTTEQDHVVEMSARALIVQGTSERQLLPDQRCDLALTDPPYHDDVQYEELSLPLRAWARLPMDASDSDVAVNPRQARPEAQASLLSRIFRETRRTLKADGHLIFSFANRDLRAWAELLNALQTAGFRTVGTEVIHSENEVDAAKRNVRACNLDLILDMAPVGPAPVIAHTPTAVDGDEGDFLQRISAFVHQVGALEHGWEDDLRTQLSGHPFLAVRKPAVVPVSAH